jgi:hypothetical protein
MNKKFILFGFLFLLFLSAAVHAQNPPLSPGYLTAKGRDDCQMFTADTKDKTYTWDGKCVDGFAEGEGKGEVFIQGKSTAKFITRYVRGKQVFTEIKSDTYRYVGQMKDGLWDGLGSFVGTDYMYVGEWKNDVQHGKGMAYSRNKKFEHIKPYGTFFENGKYIKEGPTIGIYYLDSLEKPKELDDEEFSILKLELDRTITDMGESHKIYLNQKQRAEKEAEDKYYANKDKERQQLLIKCLNSTKVSVCNIGVPFNHQNNQFSVKFTSQNNLSVAIKDITFRCHYVAKSGTVIGSHERQLFEKIDAGQQVNITIVIPRIDQTNSFNCSAKSWK